CGAGAPGHCCRERHKTSWTRAVGGGVEANGPDRAQHPEFNRHDRQRIGRRHSRRTLSRSPVAEFPDLQFRLFHSAAEVSGDLPEIDVMIMFGIEIRDQMLRDAPRLKWIQSLATGVDHFLRCPSLRHEVLITSGRGIHGVPMREHVMMAMSHNTMQQMEDYQRHRWRRRLWTTLYGKTAVIAGTGIVGAAIGELLQGLGMHVIGVSRTPRKAIGFDEIASLERLRDAAAKADYLINVLPAVAENSNLFN